MKTETTLSTKGQVTIPAKFRRELGLEPQDKIRFTLEEGILKLEPIRKRDLLALYQSVKTPDEGADLADIREDVQEAIGRQAAREGT